MKDEHYPPLLKTLIKHCGYLSEKLVIVDANDSDNPILDVNDEFESFTGYSREEVVGKNPRFLQGNKTNRGSLNKFKEEIQKGKSGSAYVLNYKKDGSTFWNHFLAIPITEKSGKTIYWAGILRDVSSIIENVKSQSELDAMVATIHSISDVVSNYMDYLQFFRAYLEEETSIDKNKLEEFDANYFYLLQEMKQLNRIERFNEIIKWNDSFYDYSKKLA